MILSSVLKLIERRYATLNVCCNGFSQSFESISETKYSFNHIPFKVSLVGLERDDIHTGIRIGHHPALGLLLPKAHLSTSSGLHC
jgi:hypothetical protein